jgi:mRNA-degrading endonuclease YafQ of YafQ-DinJ toxin-antitoxin module
MIQVIESPGYKRAYKKLILGNAQLREKYLQKLLTFVKNPHDQSLHTHKLNGRLKLSWSFSITHEIRIVFRFVSEELVLLEDIGTHDEVY